MAKRATKKKVTKKPIESYGHKDKKRANNSRGSAGNQRFDRRRLEGLCAQYLDFFGRCSDEEPEI